MWKVIVIVCTLGNPCVMFDEDPVKYYKDKNECLNVAQEKHDGLIETFGEYGYAVTDTRFSCEQDNNSL